jgi:hypothetical protein
MFDLSLFFSQPVVSDFTPEQLGNKVVFSPDNSDEIEEGSVCLFYVPEFRGDKINDHDQPLEFRSVLYELYPASDWNKKVYDLGNLNPGESLNDTYFAIQTVVSTLLKLNCVPIVIGGSMDLSYPIAVGFESNEQLFNICCVDEKVHLGEPNQEVKSNGYLSALLLRRPCFLFNHATIGIQPNRNNPASLDLYDKLFFDECRLGAFNADFKTAEPMLRNADIVCLNLEAIKASERQQKAGNPNGFTVEQICQIAKYAGISDKTSCLGIFNPDEPNNMDASIVAHGIWYFLEGVENRKGDFPIGSKKDYLRFNVVLEEANQELVFYKSNKSDRWWLEVPYPPNEFSKFERHHLVPCNQSDYDHAMNNELPNIWWKTYQKLG